ncbi:MAG: hypothetical protein H6726_14955 [Sandaracinaceae bacterium]|nr:hypothetical protein [Myxococcales bacterium]MCB9658948.1 hypothetical protein [Sandaracinaceae bacterium]
MRPLLSAAVLALTLVHALPSVRATTLRYQSVEDLAASADAVVWGDVVRLGTRLERTSQGLRPEREAELEVLEVLAGQAPGDLRVALRGGAHRHGERRVDGEARLREGEEVVLFLVRDAARWRVLGMALGVWRVQRPVGRGAPSVVSGRDGSVPDLQLVRRVDDAVVLGGRGEPRPVDEQLSLADLRAVLARTRTASP